MEKAVGGKRDEIRFREVTRTICASHQSDQAVQWRARGDVCEDKLGGDEE